ncbi:MAG: ParB/RepB/Spo0J family partition protein [Thermodesulfobacteriota bacterium]
MPKRKALGRGLEALLPDREEEGSFFYCKIEDIHSSTLQPRKVFNDAKLEELTESIKENGVIQPLIVRKASNGYELIAGERRWRAAHRAGIEQVPVVVLEVSNRESLELAVVENIQREDLNPIEEAGAYKRLIEDFEYSQEEVARRVGKDRTTITNSLRLLKLPSDIKDELVKGNLTVGHARTLLSVEGPLLQRNLSRTILKKGLSVRETELLVKRNKTDKKRERVISNEYSAFLYLEDDLRDVLGTKVKITSKGKGGRIAIEFYSIDDLDRIVGCIRGGQIRE